MILFAASVYLYFNHENFTYFFAAGKLNCFFLVLMSVIFAGVSIYNADFLIKQEIPGLKGAYYTAALLGFAAAMSGVILSSNLGMMWVFVEATTLASAYLIYFKGGKAALEAAWKYIFICSIGIAFAFMGIIFLSMSYSGQNGSLSFEWLQANAAGFAPLWLKLAFVFMAVGFGTKTGLAPVHAWLPDAHSEAPSPVSALLSASLLNTAMLALIRIYMIMTAAGMERFASFYMMFMGLLSVFVAAVYLVRVGNYKRMLAYSSIENMGIIAVALSLGRAAFPAVLIQIAGHSLSKAAFFLTSGNILRKFGHKEITPVTGILKTDNKTAWLWILSFVMVAGIPPSPLFISEFLIIKEMLIKTMWPQAVLLLVLMTIVIYGMASAVFKMCFGQPPQGITAGGFGPARYAPQAVFILMLAAMTIYLAIILV
jgi:hydrogenase-4 component F